MALPRWDPTDQHGQTNQGEVNLNMADLSNDPFANILNDSSSGGTASATEAAPQDDMDDIISGLSDEEKKIIMEASQAKAKKDDEEAAKVQKVGEQLQQQQQQVAQGSQSEVADQKAMSTSFYDALDDQQKATIDSLSAKQLKEFLKNEGLIVDFGKEALEHLNQVVDKMLQEQRGINVKEVDDLLTQANRDIDGYISKYSDDIELEKKESKLVGFFKRNKRKAVDWRFAQKDVIEKINALDAKMIFKREQLKRSFYYTNELLISNREAMENMVGYLAAMESIHTLAVQYAAKIKEKLDKTDPNSPEYNVVQEQLTKIADVTNAIDQQHANYMARLAISWATNSQVHNLQRAQTTVVRNIAMVHTHTIPTMKSSIAQIQIISQVKEAARATNAINEANEHALNMLMKLQTEDLPQIEEQAQKPITSAETITRLAESVKSANEKLVQAINSGQASRRALEEAVQSAGNIIKEADKIRDTQLADALIGEKDQTKADIAKLTNEFNAAASEAFDSTKGTDFDSIMNE